MSSPELSRRVDAHEEDLRAISDTVLEIRDDVAHIKTEHGARLDELSSKLDAVLTLLAPGKDDEPASDAGSH